MGTKAVKPKEQPSGTPTSLLLSIVCTIVVFALAEIQNSLTLGEAFSMRYVLLSYIGLGLALAFFWKRLENSPLQKVSSVLYLFGLWVSLFVTSLAPILLDGENPLIMQSIIQQFGLGFVALSGLLLMTALVQNQKMSPGLGLSSLGALGLVVTSSGGFLYKAQHLDSASSLAQNSAGHAEDDEHGEEGESEGKERGRGEGEGEEIASHASPHSDSNAHAAPVHGEAEPGSAHGAALPHETASVHHGAPSAPAKHAEVPVHGAPEALVKSSPSRLKFAAKALHEDALAHSPVAKANHEEPAEDSHDEAPAPSPVAGLPIHAVPAISKRSVKAGPVHWSYEGGQNTPEHWGELADEFRTCAVGTHQSPIDIPKAWPAIDDVTLDYKLTSLSILDNGHTVQFNVGDQNFATIAGRRYKLVQFHIHSPSEHWIDGRQSPMEIHFVHKDDKNHLAVIGVLVEAGTQPQKAFGEMWSFVPQGINAPASPKNKLFNIASLLPQKPKVYRYSGSLTTPPCSENVVWSVAADRLILSKDQVDSFKTHYRNNARPVQKRAALAH